MGVLRIGPYPYIFYIFLKENIVIFGKIWDVNPETIIKNSFTRKVFQDHEAVIKFMLSGKENFEAALDYFSKFARPYSTAFISEDRSTRNRSSRKELCFSKNGYGGEPDYTIISSGGHYGTLSNKKSKNRLVFDDDAPIIILLAQAFAPSIKIFKFEDDKNPSECFLPVLNKITGEFL